jgi:hypothetical protein
MTIPSTPGSIPLNALSAGSSQEDIHDLAFVAFHRLDMLFLPSAWSAAPKISCVGKSMDFPPKQNRKDLPKEPGVYVFVVSTDVFDFPCANGVFYVGKAKSIYDRVGAYVGKESLRLLNTKRPLVWRMINQWSGHLKYFYTPTTDVAAAKHLENEMINALRPYFNTQYDATTSKTMRAF